MQRIVGLVFSGLACRAYGAGLALWVGLEAAAFIRHAFASVALAF